MTVRVVVLSLVLLCSLDAAAAGPTFRPDVIFRGSSLAGWTPVGQADWRAESGEIIGAPRAPGGGWLVLGSSYEDVAVFANVTCTGTCHAGVLLRAEQTPDGGLKGVFVSIADSDRGIYAVTIDAEGRETSRRVLPAGSVLDMAMGRSPGQAPAAPPGPPAWAPPPLPAGVDLPGLASLPMGEYVPGRTNAVDVTLTRDAVLVRFNGGSLLSAAGAMDASAGTYGALALFSGGTGTTHFKDVAYADLNARPFDAEHTSPNFRVRRLSEFYSSYSAAVADVNRDGSPDVIAGPSYYLGPSLTVGRQFYNGATYNPTSEYPLASMVNLASDFTGDGWPDVLVMSGNAGNGIGTLYVNPRGENRRWDAHVVLEPVGNEETLLKDIDGDGRLEVIHSGGNTLRFSKPDPASPTGPWITTTISETGPWGVNVGHGMGVGDIDGDGLMDYVNAYGWWQQPPRGSSQRIWTWHPVAFARWGASQGGAGGAEMGIYDVNGDGLNDVVTALEGHGFGLAWYEQTRGVDGRPTFVQHRFMDGFLDPAAGGVVFTQPHATAFADINQDGVLDLIVGKRHHSHFQYTDPDNWGMPVVYVYTVRRNPNAPGGAEFVPELVHNRSGVGSHLGIGDLDGNGTPDIVTSGASGTFVFFNQTTRGQ